jgi:hypothetical protein
MSQLRRSKCGVPADANDLQEISYHPRRTQVRVGRAAENHELIVHARLGAGSHANGETISARFVSSRARQQSKDSNM